MGVVNSPPLESFLKSMGQESGLHVEYGTAVFTTTATSETLKTRMLQVAAVFLTPITVPTVDEHLYWDQPSTTNGWFSVTAGSITVKRVQAALSKDVSIGSLTATGGVSFVLPRAGTITAVKFTTATDITPDDTNYWTFDLDNETATLAPVDGAAASDVNTTKLAKIDPAAHVPNSLTLGAAAQLVVVANDVFSFVATKSASATSMTECSLQVSWTASVTSALAFNYAIVGRKG